MSQRTSRRTFVKAAAAAGLTMPLVMPRLVRAQSPNSTLTVAFVGTAGRAGAHVHEMHKMGVNCSAYAEVDVKRQGDAAKFWPQAKAFQDYRKMFDEAHKGFDAVFVAVPDHHHFPAAMLGLLHDKHVYCEKPLTWSVWEARRLAQEAAKRKLATQMGNQGHAGEGWRVAVAWLQQGAIGDVKEVHTWTNRPIWPQGIDRPAGSDPVPANLDWDLWLGPAPVRPFKDNTYHPFKWRGWFDFGAGAFGDMACHTWDGMFWALTPGSPTEVKLVETTGHNGDSFPNKTIVKFDFAASGNRPGFTSYWYDGRPEYHNKPARPEDVKQEEWDKITSGNLFVGTKGILRVWGDYGNSPRILGKLGEEVGAPKHPIEKSPGHHAEFVMAAKGEKPHDFPKSNFSYAGPMTEVIQVGVIAQRMNLKGETLKYEGQSMRFTNNDKANAFINREPRKGWKVV